MTIRSSCGFAYKQTIFRVAFLQLIMLKLYTSLLAITLVTGSALAAPILNPLQTRDLTQG